MFSSRGDFRPPSVAEREAMLGFPLGYTRQCLGKSKHGTEFHSDCKLSLLGNSRSVPIIAWILSVLFHRLGFLDALSIQQIVDRLCPGQSQTHTLQGLLLRPPMTWSTSTLDSSALLVRKLFGSLKGEDLLLQHHTDVPVRYHRLRMSIPARLWRWRALSGWRTYQRVGITSRSYGDQVAG